MLKFDDPVKSAIIKEDILSKITELNTTQKEIVINRLIDIMEESSNILFIKKVFQIIDIIAFTKNEDSLRFAQILKKVKNEYVILNILKKLALNPKNMRDFVPYGLSSDNRIIHNFTIENIGKFQIRDSYGKIEEVFMICVQILKEETNLFNIKTINTNYSEDDFFIKSEEIRKIDGNIKLPEIFEFNQEFDILIRNKLQNQSNDPFFSINRVPFNLKKKFIRHIIEKFNLIIEQIIITKQSFALEIIRELTNNMQISQATIPDQHIKLDLIIKIIENQKERNISGISDLELLISMKSLLFKYLGLFGNRKDLDFLVYRFKIEKGYEVRIAIIYALKLLNNEKGEIIETLKEIDKDEKFSFYALSCLIEIGGEEIEQYILNQLYLGNLRRIFLISFFIPILKNRAFDKFAIDLLSYKQPLFIRRGLWIIKKKKIADAIPLIINHIFSENIELKNDAIETLLVFRGKSLPFLRKNVNYYGDEKKTVILELINTIENKIQKKIA